MENNGEHTQVAPGQSGKPGRHLCGTDRPTSVYTILTEQGSLALCGYHADCEKVKFCS